MPAKTMDLLIEQGATYDLTFVWADIETSNGTTSQTPKDLTGCSARMQIRAGYDKAVLLEATTDNGRIILGTGGEVRVLLPEAVTDGAPVSQGPDGKSRLRRRAKYDLEVVWPSGRVDRVLEGKVTFSPNITRPT